MTGLFTRYLHFVHLLPGKLLRQFCRRPFQAILSLHHLLDSSNICGIDCWRCWRPHKLVRHHPLKCCCAHGGSHCWRGCFLEQIGNGTHVHGAGARRSCWVTWVQIYSMIRMFLIRMVLVLLLEWLMLKDSPVVDLVNRNGSWLVSGAGVVAEIWMIFFASIRFCWLTGSQKVGHLSCWTCWRGRLARC